MAKKAFFGFAYVSVWVIIWGTFGSLVDLPFLNANIYSAGSLGQAATFFLTGFISVLLGYWVYPKIISIKFIADLFNESSST